MKPRHASTSKENKKEEGATATTPHTQASGERDGQAAPTPQATPCNNNLPVGTFVVGNGLYARCEDCGQIVRINKPIFGSLHSCVP